MTDFYLYLPVDDIVMQWGIYLTGAGIETNPAGTEYPPEGHPNLYNFRWETGRILPEFQIILITDGYGIFESKQTGKVDLEPNTLIILFPEIWHRYRPNKKYGWTQRWISLNGTIPHYLVDHRYLDPGKPICRLHDPANLIFVFDSLLNQIYEKPTENTILTSLNAMSLLTETIKMTGGVTSSNKLLQEKDNIGTNDPLIASVLEMIWTQSHRSISVDFLLSQLPTSRRTLERRFKKVRGHSIHEEIVQCRLSRAKRLLHETNLPVKTIAYLSGFGDPEKMRYAFVTHYGKIPSEFRNSQ